jgi:putative lipoprotein
MKTQPKITGTITYLQRIALPLDSVVSVKLQDVSAADAPAVVLSAQEFTGGGKQVPFAFELTYDRAQIDEKLRYSVSARITDANGKVIFTNTSAYFVITQGSPIHDIDILVNKVG